MRALNEVWPGGDILYEVGEGEGKSALKSRKKDFAKWLASAAGQGKWPMMSNAADLAFTIAGSNWVVDFKSGEQSLLSAWCHVPARPETLTLTNELLARVCTATEAHWGAATSLRTGARIGRQVQPREGGREGPLGLPRLLVTDDLAGPDVPQVLGWINYWSAPTVARLAFPATERKRGEDWVRRARRLESGAWVVQLTDDSLDLDRSDHLKVLQRAYKRFAAVGRAAG